MPDEIPPPPTVVPVVPPPPVVSAPPVPIPEPQKYDCPNCRDKNDYREVGLEYDDMRRRILSICPSCSAEITLRTIDRPYFLDRLKAGGLA